MKNKVYMIISLIILCAFCTDCSDNTLRDGYYAAEMSEYDFGWKEYVTIIVKNGKIVSADYNAKNVSGFIKSWDNAYMKNMNSVSETYPNEYTKLYAAQLKENKNGDNIDMISGATESGMNFRVLSKAVVEKVQKGDSSSASVSLK